MAEVNLIKSCLSEFILTFLLIFVVFIFSFSKINEKIKFGKKVWNNWAPLIVGFSLVLLIYISLFIMEYSEYTVLSGHMSSLYTLYCIISNILYGESSLYGLGVTPRIGGALIGAQFAGLFFALFILWIIYEFALKDRKKN